MINKKVWYTIRKNDKGYTVWQNSEFHYDNGSHGGMGSYGLYTAKNRIDCINFCKKHKIKISRNK